MIRNVFSHWLFFKFYKRIYNSDITLVKLYRIILYTYIFFLNLLIRDKI